MRFTHLSMAAATLVGSIFMSCQQAEVASNQPLEELKINVSNDENREYAFSNKKASYFYGKTHENDFADWHAGWNIAKQRIFSNYALWSNDSLANRQKAKTAVYPHVLERIHNTFVEQLYLLDNQEILYISVKPQQDLQTIGISLSERMLQEPSVQGSFAYYKTKHAPGYVVVAPFHDQSISLGEKGQLQTLPTAEGFLISYAEDTLQANALIKQFRKEGQNWLAQRKQRMEKQLTELTPIQSNNDTLDHALQWITLTTDLLVTRQQGHGIYAGLPWFNEYWGRDMFISMPGATLVTGQFETTKSILKDFSRFQDVDPQSPTWGRIPNRANLEGILYNTTDGTPRFIIQIYEYLKYSGDTDFLKEIYPAVKTSIVASIKKFSDKQGYLIHDDADTWMDVKRNGIPGSPRGNRANDIQALWHQQLLAGAEMAWLMEDDAHAQQWKTLAEKLEKNFEKDYSVGWKDQIADHLNKDGSRDNQFRPNQLYTFALIKDEQKKMEVTRSVWEKLVFPWGVASLDQQDAQFHPYHENWHYYHKDDAYHNGTVWLWNNGEAMQRMLEFDQSDIAYTLFNNMNKQALIYGAIGSLSENADAHPREGKNWAKRSGTFLQAWSNAEQLRVWYQHFLGIRPNMLDSQITIEPKLPTGINNVAFSQRLGQGFLEGEITTQGSSTTYAYKLVDEQSQISLAVAPFEKTTFSVFPGETLIAKQTGDQLTIQIKHIDDTYKTVTTLTADPARIKQIQERNAFFQGTDFAQVFLQENLPCLKQYHPEALTY